MPLFNISQANLAKTGAFDEFVLDYLDLSPKTVKFSEYAPNLDGLLNCLEKQENRKSNRSLLTEVLRDQYSFLQGSDGSELLNKRIDSLQNSDTFTVCTGHQLNILTGPYYTILKIISTIKTARILSDQSGKTVLPVFWMASEDHDMDEISHFNIYGHRYEWKTEWKGPAGRSSCRGIPELVNTLKDKFSSFLHSKDIFSALESAYHPSNSLAFATRKFLHHLFGKHGLLILDADDARLKREFVPHMLNDVKNHLAFSKVNETISSMHSEYKPQVHPRQVNLFYLYDDLRERIDASEGRYTLQNKSHTWNEEELIAEISRWPERFSPNVVLRPLYQELILPNIAVIGGPAELAYWLELKSFFDASGIAYPVMLLRNSALFIDVQSKDRLQKFKIDSEKLFRSSDEWIKTFLNSNPESEFSIKEFENRFDQEFDQLAMEVEQIDKSLKPLVESERSKLHKAFTHIEERLIRSAKKKHETEINQLNKLHDKLFPGGKLQERTENILPLLLTYGDALIVDLIDKLDPLNPGLLIFSEQKDV